MNYKKLCAVVTGLCFLFTVSAPSISAVSLPSAVTSARATNLLDDFPLVSPKYGKITEINNYNSTLTVINVQDLHGSAEVQKNIYEILNGISKKNAIKAIYVEGGYGSVDTGWLFKISDKTLREKIIKGMLDNGTLSGAEYYGLYNGNIPVYGLEDKTLHMENLARLSNLIDNQPYFESVLNLMDADVQFISSKYLSKNNALLNKLVFENMSGKISSGKFYSKLFFAAGTINKANHQYSNLYNIDLNTYPNLTLYAQLSSMPLDKKAATSEMSAFVRALQNVMPYSLYKDLLYKTENFSDIYALAGYVKGLVKIYGIDMSDYPALDMYVNYIERLNLLNPVQVIDEERRLTDTIRNSYSQTLQEAEIAFICGFYPYFKNYLTNSLTSADYGYFARNFNRFRELYAKYAYINRLLPLEKYFDELNAYYEVNNERNTVFLDQILSHEDVKENDIALNAGTVITGAENVAVMVTGGYHSKGMNALFEKAKINNVVVTPSVSSDRLGKSYDNYQLNVKRQAKFAAESLNFTIAASVTDVQQFRLALDAALSYLTEDNFNDVISELRGVLKDDKVEAINAGDTVEILINGSTVAVLRKENGKFTDITPSDIAKNVAPAELEQASFNLVDKMIEIFFEMFPNADFNNGLIVELSGLNKSEIQSIAGVDVALIARMPKSLQQHFYDKLFIEDKIIVNGENALSESVPSSAKSVGMALAYAKAKAAVQKIILGMMALVMAFALSACNPQNYDTDQQPTVEIVTQSVIEKPAFNGVAKSYLQDGKLYVEDVDGKLIDYKIQGICYAYNGESYRRAPGGSEYYANYKADIEELTEMNVDSIRTYRPLAEYNSDGSLNIEKTTEMLDAFYKVRITVTVGFNKEDIENGLFEDYLKNFASHPAVLMVVVGNEFDAHPEWFGGNVLNWYELIDESVVPLVEQYPEIVFATVETDRGDAANIEKAGYFESRGMLLMLNVYRGGSFGTLPAAWDKAVKDGIISVPLMISEYGRSSMDFEGNDTSGEQTSTDSVLIAELKNNYSASGAGGYLFTFTLSRDAYNGAFNETIGHEYGLAVTDNDELIDVISDLYSNHNTSKITVTKPDAAAIAGDAEFEIIEIVDENRPQSGPGWMSTSFFLDGDSLEAGDKVRMEIEVEQDMNISVQVIDSKDAGPKLDSRFAVAAEIVPLKAGEVNIVDFTVPKNVKNSSDFIQVIISSGEEFYGAVLNDGKMPVDTSKITIKKVNAVLPFTQKYIVDKLYGRVPNIVLSMIVSAVEIIPAFLPVVFVFMHKDKQGRMGAAILQLITFLIGAVLITSAGFMPAVLAAVAGVNFVAHTIMNLRYFTKGGITVFSASDSEEFISAGKAPGMQNVVIVSGKITPDIKDVLKNTGISYNGSPVYYYEKDKAVYVMTGSDISDYNGLSAYLSDKLAINSQIVKVDYGARAAKIVFEDGIIKINRAQYKILLEGDLNALIGYTETAKKLSVASKNQIYRYLDDAVTLDLLSAAVSNEALNTDNIVLSSEIVKAVPSEDLNRVLLELKTAGIAVYLMTNEKNRLDALKAVQGLNFNGAFFNEDETLKFIEKASFEVTDADSILDYSSISGVVGVLQNSTRDIVFSDSALKTLCQNEASDPVAFKMLRSIFKSGERLFAPKKLNENFIKTLSGKYGWEYFKDINFDEVLVKTEQSDVNALEGIFAAHNKEFSALFDMIESASTEPDKSAQLKQALVKSLTSRMLALFALAKNGKALGLKDKSLEGLLGEALYQSVVMQKVSFESTIAISDSIANLTGLESKAMLKEKLYSSLDVELSLDIISLILVAADDNNKVEVAKIETSKISTAKAFLAAA
jgi:hypothetical protein